MQVFFVCGAPKSGTTWLQRVLDAHPEVICSGEGHFIQRFTIPLATVVREYNDYSRLVADRVYEGTPYYEPVDQQDFDRVARTFIMDRLIFRKPGPGVCWVGTRRRGMPCTCVNSTEFSRSAASSISSATHATPSCPGWAMRRVQEWSRPPRLTRPSGCRSSGAG